MSRSSISSLPPAIGRLTRLRELKLQSTRLLTLPDEIGNLSDLKLLDLKNSNQLTTLPSEIGDLSSLMILDLYRCEEIESLPPSIGRLKNLQRLDLSGFNQLPDEIGDLIELRILNLQNSGLRALPPWIGNLQKLHSLSLSGFTQLTALPSDIGLLRDLKSLCLGDNSELTTLPEEIGNLSKLTYLILSGCLHIESLPPSIGLLRDLECLHLANTSELTTLPEEIGNLCSLKELDLDNSSVISLPNSMRHLTGLLYLSIRNTRICQQAEYLSTLVDQLPLLTSLRLNNGPHSWMEKLNWKLACNRATYQIQTTAGIFGTPKLLPHILSQATALYKTYPPCESKTKGRQTYTMSEPDAIYDLLVRGRESFVEVLIHRNKDAQKCQMEM